MSLISTSPAPGSQMCVTVSGLVTKFRSFCSHFNSSHLPRLFLDTDYEHLLFKKCPGRACLHTHEHMVSQPRLVNVPKETGEASYCDTSVTRQITSRPVLGPNHISCYFFRYQGLL